MFETVNTSIFKATATAVARKAAAAVAVVVVVGGRDGAARAVTRLAGVVVECLRWRQNCCPSMHTRTNTWTWHSWRVMRTMSTMMCKGAARPLVQAEVG